MALISLPNTLTDGTTASATPVMSNFTTIYNDYNGNITNANVSASAAISASKLSLATIAQTMAMSSAAINFAKGSDIASATTTDIGAASGNYVHVTGTTTITGLGTVQAGTMRFVRFTGILTLTHNATSLILPTSANITTAADDEAIFVSLGSGNWKCINYERKDGSPLVSATASTALAGSIIQVVNTQTGATSSGTTAIPQDDTIPQNTEGDEYMTLSITPNNANNKLKISVVWNGANGASGAIIVALFQDSTANALACQMIPSVGTSSTLGFTSFTHYMTAGTASSTTFKVRAGANAGTTYFNGGATGRQWGGVAASSITIEEIKV